MNQNKVTSIAHEILDSRMRLEQPLPQTLLDLEWSVATSTTRLLGASRTKMEIAIKSYPHLDWFRIIPPSITNET